jgi:hypothetical protein
MPDDGFSFYLFFLGFAVWDISVIILMSVRWNDYF